MRPRRVLHCSMTSRPPKGAELINRRTYNRRTALLKPRNPREDWTDCILQSGHKKMVFELVVTGITLINSALWHSGKRAVGTCERAGWASGRRLLTTSKDLNHERSRQFNLFH